jgi:hypothetical protein
MYLELESQAKKEEALPLHMFNTMKVGATG